MAEASEMIPTCIAGIHEFWRKLSEASVPARPQPVRRSRRRPH